MLAVKHKVYRVLQRSLKVCRIESECDRTAQSEPPDGYAPV